MIIQDVWMKDNTVYSPADIDTIINVIRPNCIYVGEGRSKILNIPISFDTETTSFYDKHNGKTAIVYVWMLGICGMVIVGRTWDEWMYCYKRLVYNFRTNEKRRLIIYVHNLSFDYQFIRKHHNFTKVFAMDKYKPLYAMTDEGIEFRCSYLLSGYSLYTIGKNLHYHKVQKLKGDLDYRQLRHNQTPLSDLELGYCINDAKLVCAYIDETIDREGDISKIPLTKTGYVRRYCREECFKEMGYKNLIQSLVLTPDEFQLCKSAFQGGYTHANPLNVDEVIEDVTSMDIISSYPSVMVDELFPMSKPYHATISSIDEFRHYLRNYSCVFEIQLNNVRPRYDFDYYLSSSKCKITGELQIFNGRVAYAESLVTTITDVDFDIIDYMYKYDNFSIGEFMYFERAYLPTPFVKSLLELYQRKTELKGVKGYEVEYAVIKENQNSFYGMTVTSPIRPFYMYDGEWHDGKEPELDVAMKSYNNSHTRFLYYPWGVFVTAYARHNIWEGIIACANDHIYTDTDSEKFKNFSAHVEFFESYNRRVIEKHKRACKAHNIDVNKCMPKNKDGKVKILGAFELDGKYDRFKTLGAKRYLYEHDSQYGLTVAGLNKSSGMQYLKDNYKNAFEGFNDGLVVPPEFSGRLVHTYIDERRTGMLTDMYGVTAPYDELSGVHLEPATYTLGLTGDFIRFITGVKESDLYGVD